ncbi:toprim domain-containing protein [Gimesia fumaroli]|uniref:DNA primase n=1 Tax=Gimesia fumaroli TaxID=2527976 RepID=A0A518I5U3_9PLAN|nr:toprim domain-containing protein [Gimesia fumaroli]QDV48471.1 DNA primase [Gimesia fumaroli]
MAHRNRGYIDVDSLQQELIADGDIVERIASFYNVSLPELHKTQNETRLACIFACGKEQETGDRAISIKIKQDGAVFRCFQYGCTVRGNLLNLMYLMKHNSEPADGKLKGRDFKEIAADLQALVAGRPPEKNVGTVSTSQSSTTESMNDKSPLINIPLKDSENERARELINLNEQFITDVAEMSPQAAAYVRKRPFMTPEIMKKFHCGYLPSNAKGLLRGHFVYGYPDADGNVLTWFGRNLNYEDQHKKWQRSGDSSKEPHKFKFVKGFHRGQELYGEPQFHGLATPEQLQQIGIILVEGPNDVINLHTLGIPALAVCSNTVTESQADKLATLANSIPGGHVSVMFDLDREGENGAKQTVMELAKRCRVRLAWSIDFADGRFKGRQPESVTVEDWDTAILPTLMHVS